MIDSILQIFLSSLILYIACTNLLPISLKYKYRGMIFFYILLLSIFLYPLLGQAGTPITLSGVLLIIASADSRRLLNVCCSLFGYASSIVLNYLITNFLDLRFGITITMIYSDYIILFSALFAVLIFLVTSALKWLLWKKSRLQDLKISKSIMFFVLLNLMACVLIFVFNFTYAEKLGYDTRVVQFNSILFSAYFIFTTFLLFVVVKAISKEEQMKYMLGQYENMQDYTNKVEKLYMDMRSFKHDYVNILSTLSCYIENKDMNGLENYFSKEIVPLHQSFDQSNTKLGLLSNVKILELKSLLYSKVINALTNHIEVFLDIAEPIDTINMKFLDLNRVLAIFLDNAIESAMNTQEKQLDIGIIQKDDSILIIIRNSCDTEELHLNRIYESGFSTKGTNRGIGLYSAKQVLNHYNNIIHSTSVKDSYFIQQLEVTNPMMHRKKV